MKEFIAEWGLLIVAAVILVIGAAIAIIRFAKMPKKQQIEVIGKWLLYIVMEAEQIFGGKTGALKLVYAYDRFIEKFPAVAKVLPFEKFSELVDKALEEMEELIKNNESIAALVESR